MGERRGARGEGEVWEKEGRGRGPESGRCDVQFNVHPRDGTHVD